MSDGEIEKESKTDQYVRFISQKQDEKTTYEESTVTVIQNFAKII